MAVTKKQRAVVYPPVWIPGNNIPAGAVSTALSTSCAAQNTTFNANTGRYIFYLISAAVFFAYDTWTETFVECTPPPVATATWTAMEFSENRGMEGRTLAATSTTITLPAYSTQRVLGYDISIISGTGAGQRRIIDAVAEPVQADFGVATAVNNVLGAITITDSTKAWTFNEWAGYQVRIINGSGVGQVRRVLYNSATVLTLGDSTKSADDSFCNPVIFSPAISATAGSQSVYAIESSVATVNSAWGVTPDTTSRFRIHSGALWLTSSAAAAPFYTMQFYEVATDTWYIKQSHSLMLAAVGGDGSMEHSPESMSFWWTNNANGTQSTTSIQDLVQSYGNQVEGTAFPSFTTNWTAGQWIGYYVYVFSGTGAGQVSKITANTSNTLTVSLGTALDATSQYGITGYSGGTSSGSNTTTTLNDTTKAWQTNDYTNYTAKILFGTGAGQIRPIASNTATALTLVSPWTTTPDATSVYFIFADDDKVFMHASNNTCFPIYNIEDDITTLGRIQSSGTAGIAAVYLSNQAEAINWRGIYKPQAIASGTYATTTITITTVNAHNFQVGQSVTVVGATSTGAASYNGTYTITAVASATTFTYTSTNPGANMTGSTAQSTTTLTDPTKTWTVNQWAGYIVTFNSTAETAASGAVTIESALIASNTANTLTFAAVTTAPTSGTSKYAIHSEHIIGVANATTDQGAATSGSTTTLVDTTKTWVVNLYAGRRVKITGGTGQGQDLLISSNTANTLTFPAATAPAANSTYAIVQQYVRGTGACLNWADNGIGIAGATETSTPNARWCYIARGGAVYGFDRIDFTTDQVSLLPLSAGPLTLALGAQYAYDGNDRLYFTKIDTVEQRLYYLDLLTFDVHGGSMTPFLLPTAVGSNRMEIYQTVDGQKYLWIQQGGQAAYYRQLLFW